MSRAWSPREIQTYLARVLPVLDKLDHFELLDIGVDASAQEIQAAFHNMAAGLHPDRQRGRLTYESRERLTIVYARIAEAYRVLRDPEERGRYLQRARREHQRQAAEGGPPREQASLSAAEAIALLSPKAQRLYRRAEVAMRTGDQASAVLNLKMALAKHPQSELLKAALARAKSG